MSAKTQTTGQPGLIGASERAIDGALRQAMEISRHNGSEAGVSPTDAADVLCWLDASHAEFREKALADVQAWLRRVTV